MPEAFARLTGCTVLVTGGASGIGITEILAEAGAGKQVAALIEAAITPTICASISPTRPRSSRDAPK